MTGDRDQSLSRAALARDAALGRIRRTRRWVIVGTAGLTAGFAALVAAVAPGRSLGSSSGSHVGAETATAGASSGSALPKLPALANPADLGLQGPGQAPQSVPNQSQAPPAQSAPSPSDGGGGGGGPVVSGGS
jgi:hypothetical protein